MYSWAVPQGIFVCLVIPGSPAAMAGLRLDHLLHLFSSFRFIVSLNFCEYNYVEVWRPASHAWSNCPRRNDFRRRPLQVGFWPNISFFSSFSGFGVDQWTTLLWRWVFMGNFFTPCFHQEVLSTKVRDRPICRSMVLHKDPAGRSPSPTCLEHWVFSLKRHLLGHQSWK